MESFNLNIQELLQSKLVVPIKEQFAKQELELQRLQKKCKKLMFALIGIGVLSVAALALAILSLTKIN